MKGLHTDKGILANGKEENNIKMTILTEHSIMEVFLN